MSEHTKANRMAVWLIAATAFIASALIATLAYSAPASAASSDTGTYQSMYRLYNPNSGEHFYTASDAEKGHLVGVGWQDEGTGWVAPTSSDHPVYRLYNANAGDHHYTMSEAEKDMLVSMGWNYEGVGWKSADESGVALYRQYNPNATAGSHNYTASKAENDALVAAGWHEEGIGWYGHNATWVAETGHFETVTVTEAWDEPVYDYRFVHVCNACGFETPDTRVMRDHIVNHARNDEVSSTGLIEKYTQVDTIHHDAVTEQRWVVNTPGHWE